jgi:hypothetical protein
MVTLKTPHMRIAVAAALGMRVATMKAKKQTAILSPIDVKRPARIADMEGHG